jgi:hypothetical protein
MRISKYMWHLFYLIFKNVTIFYISIFIKTFTIISTLTTIWETMPQSVVVTTYHLL